MFYQFALCSAEYRRYHHEEHANGATLLHGAETAHAHTHQHTKEVVNRLSRAIGHLTAVRTMVEDGRDCSEVLVQLAAVRSSLSGAAKVILKDHMDHCIVDAVESGDTAALDELNRAIELLLK